MHFIGLHSQPGDVVLDPFCGHGWVGVACKRMGRKFIGIEIDPAFAEVAMMEFDSAETGVPRKEAIAGQMALWSVK